MLKLMLTKEIVIRILHEFKEDIKKVLRNNFVEMILFGLYARGNYREYSDVDVLIVVEMQNFKKRSMKFQINFL